MKVLCSISLAASLAVKVKSDNQLYLKNLTCDESYPVTVIGASFSCGNGCDFGSSGGFKSLMSYSDMDIQDLYTTSLMNFTAFTNESAYNSVSDTGFSQQMFFGSMIDLCENSTDDSSCELGDGNFSESFEYTIPSAGNLNSYFAGFTVESNVRVYDYYNNMDLVGDCFLLLTTEAPVVYSDYSYQSVSSHSGFYFAAAAAIICAMVFLLPAPAPEDDKRKKLLPENNEGNDNPASFDDDLNPDVIERERSVYKGGLDDDKKQQPGYSDYSEQLISVQEEMVKVTVTEQIVTEEIPWPSKEDDSFDLDAIQNTYSSSAKPATDATTTAVPPTSETSPAMEETKSVDTFERIRNSVDPPTSNTPATNLTIGIDNKNSSPFESELV